MNRHEPIIMDSVEDEGVKPSRASVELWYGAAFGCDVAVCRTGYPRRANAAERRRMRRAARRGRRDDCANAVAMIDLGAFGLHVRLFGGR